MSVLQSDVGTVYPGYGVFQCEPCSQTWVSFKTWKDFGQPCGTCKIYRKAAYIEKLFHYVCINCGYQWQNRKVPQPFCAKCYASDPKPFSTARERLRYMKVHFLSHPEKDEEEQPPGALERRASMVHRKRSCDKCQAGKICTWYQDKTKASVSPTATDQQIRSASDAESDADGDSMSDFISAVKTGTRVGTGTGTGAGTSTATAKGNTSGFGMTRGFPERKKQKPPLKKTMSEPGERIQNPEGKERPSKLFDVVKTRKHSLVRLHNDANFFKFSGKTSTSILGGNSSTSTANPNRADCCCFI